MLFGRFGKRVGLRPIAARARNLQSQQDERIREGEREVVIGPGAHGCKGGLGRFVRREREDSGPRAEGSDGAKNGTEAFKVDNDERHARKGVRRETVRRDNAAQVGAEQRPKSVFDTCVCANE